MAKESLLFYAVILPVFLLTLALACLIPIYTDEITWKIQNARIFLDGFVTISLFPQCASTFAVPPAWFIVPARTLDAILYANLSTPLLVRILGVVTASLWVAIALVMLPRSLAVEVKKSSISIIVISFCGLGVLPWVLVMNRPEQLLLITLTVIALWPLSIRPRLVSTGVWSGVIVCIAYLLLVMLSLAQHPKAIFFAPLFLVSAWFVVKRKRLRSACLLGTGYLLVASFIYWQYKYACVEDVQLKELFGRIMLPPSLLLSEPTLAFHAIISHLLKSYQYIGHILFQKKYMAYWLPSMSLDYLEIGVNVSIVIFFAATAVASSIFLGFLIKESWRNRVLSQRLVICLALLLSLGALDVFQGQKNAYDSLYLVPLLGLGVFITVPGALANRWIKTARVGVSCLVVTSLLSQVSLWREFMPHAYARWLNGGYLEEQPFSFSAFHYQAQRLTVLETARRCSIEVSERNPALVVDDLTYYVFASAYRPIHLFYVTPAWAYGKSIQDLGRFLTERNSAGIIAACRLFPTDLLERAKRDGPLCCLPAFSPKGAGS